MADTPNESGSIPAKCGHSACNCEVPPGKRFCSDFCEKRSRSGSAVHTETLSYQRRVLLIKHLLRLPISKRMSLSHSYVTANLR
jgi:hypothetical protein